MFDYTISHRVRSDCVWVSADKSVSDITVNCIIMCHLIRLCRITSRVMQNGTHTTFVYHIILGSDDEITYFYGNLLYVLAGIGPVPAGNVNTKSGPSLHDEVQATRR